MRHVSLLNIVTCIVCRVVCVFVQPRRRKHKKGKCKGNFILNNFNELKFSVFLYQKKRQNLAEKLRQRRHWLRPSVVDFVEYTHPARIVQNANALDWKWSPRIQRSPYSRPLNV